MLRQLEGSRAVADTVALCRPEVVAAYPISPQTHIVEGLARHVASGQLAPCEFVNVESEFAAMSVCIGASAAGARTYTATASQGLLFMVEALYNAAGLGLPVVMTVANRAIGSPINIWNDHSDAMSQRDSGWIQLYAESNQEAVDLHVQAFRLAEELSLPGHGLHGRVRPHARPRARRRARAGAGRRVPAAVRPASGPRPRRPDDDRRDGRAGGLHRGQVPHARQADGGARPRPRAGGRLRGRVRPPLGWPRARLPGRRRRDGRRGARLGPGDDRGRRRRPARAGRARRRPRRDLLPAVAARRGARPRWRPPGASWSSRRRSPSAWAGSSGRTSAWPSAACPSRSTTWSPGSAAGRSRRRRCTGLLRDALGGRLGAQTFLDLDRELVERELARGRARGRSGAHAENMLRDVGIVAGGST